MPLKEAVGLAHSRGRITYRGTISRIMQRAIIRTMACSHLPYALRERLMICGLKAARKLTRNLRWVPIMGASASNALENALLLLVFNATTWANIAVNATSSPLTNLEVSLHTADPGEAGDQTTSEVTYTSYARVAVARTSGGWTVTANSVSPVAAITFPAGTGGSGTATYFGIGSSHTGAGVLYFSGTVTPNIVTGNTITPSLTTATAITAD